MVGGAVAIRTDKTGRHRRALNARSEPPRVPTIKRGLALKGEPGCELRGDAAVNPDSSTRRIVVVGASAIDSIVTGLESYEAIRPERGKSQRIQHAVEWHAGGMALNCAFALHQMTVPVSLMTRVGNSGADKLILKEMRKRNIFPCNDESSVVRAGTSAATCVSFVYPEEGRKDRCFLFHPGHETCVTFADLKSPVFDRCIAHSDHIHFAGIGTQELGANDASLDYRMNGWLDALRASGKTTSADLAPSPVLSDKNWRRQIRSFLSSIDMLFPSDYEAKALLDTPTANAADLPGMLQDVYEVPLVCVKAGGNGCYVEGTLPKTDQSSAFCGHIPSEIHVDVRDPTGAGDVWCAGFLAAFARGRPIRSCAMAGHAAAAFSLGAIGGSAGVNSWQEVWDRVQRRDDYVENA